MTKGKRRSQQEWQSIFQQYKDSGLNVQAFCEQQDLCSKTFYAHRRRLLSQKAKSEKSTFIKVQKTSPLTPPQNNACILHYQNCKIHLCTDVDANWIAKIMKALS